MTRNTPIYTALIFLCACLFCTASIGCFQPEVKTAGKGPTGMPIQTVNPGTVPEPWMLDEADLPPFYGGAERYGSWRSWITPDEMADVVAYYKKELPNADMEEVTKDGVPFVYFKMPKYVIEITIGEGDNTLITVNKPEG